MNVLVNIQQHWKQSDNFDLDHEQVLVRQAICDVYLQILSFDLNPSRQELILVAAKLAGLHENTSMLPKDLTEINMHDVHYGAGPSLAVTWVSHYAPKGVT